MGVVSRGMAYGVIGRSRSYFMTLLYQFKIFIDWVKVLKRNCKTEEELIAFVSFRHSVLLVKMEI